MTVEPVPETVEGASEQIFRGIAVLELAQWVFVPACAAVLADLGADVVKIENPETGDPYRGLVTLGIGAHYEGVNLNWEQNNRGKRSVALDIRSDQGRELMYKLVERFDVFITNFRPDTLARLGYGYEIFVLGIPGSYMPAVTATACGDRRRTHRATTALLIGLGAASPTRSRPLTIPLKLDRGARSATSLPR